MLLVKDADNRRWIMKLDRLSNAEVREGYLGVISEDTKTHSKDMKVMVD